MSKLKLLMIMLESRLQETTRNYFRKLPAKRARLQNVMLADPDLHLTRSQASALANQCLIGPIPNSVWYYWTAKALLFDHISFN